MRNLLFITISLAMAAVHADESQIQLKNAPGRDAVQGKCSICHSLDEIQINSPFLDKAAWTAEVTKMITVMGAPIDDKEKTEIIDYLTANYGKSP